MRWQSKAALQRWLSVLPAGDWVNYRLQRWSRSRESDEESFLFRARLAAAHLAFARPHLPVPIAEVRSFEFGAGADLVGPLTLYGLGVRSQIVVDLDPLLRPVLVRGAIEALRRHAAELGLSPAPGTIRAGNRLRTVETLRRDFGIDYRAPIDARDTGLPRGSMDLISSNSTLEHVPEEELRPLVAECSRLLKPDGVICFRIDYEDHYAYFDPALSGYNFLRYSKEEWRRYNSRLQFQNRLRHRDYLEIFREGGLSVVAVETLEPSVQALAQLTPIPVHEELRTYTTAELCTRKGTFLLKNA